MTKRMENPDIIRTPVSAKGGLLQKAVSTEKNPPMEEKMTGQKCSIDRFLIMILGTALVLLSGCKAKKEMEESPLTQMAKAPDIKERLAKFTPTEMNFPRDILSPEDLAVLDKLVAAARGIDAIFWKQSYSEGLALKAELEKSTDPAGQDYLRFLKINFGPFDRQDANNPFLGTAAKPLGAGFYPPDLGRQEFEDYVKSNPEAREALESPYTIISRRDGRLVAVPYNEAYAEDLKPIALALREAAAATSNASLKAYLEGRAEGLLANEYYRSDCLWIDLKDNRVETVIGPFEVYEDGLMGLKASYESFVYINDFEEMKNIKGYIDFLDEMQKNLPVDAKYKSAKAAGLESPLNVVYEVFTAGDTKAGVQTIAFVLPNDEKVREEKGTKKVFLKNAIEAKFNKILLPISERVLDAEDQKKVSFYAYFNETILHEICHALGANFITRPDGSRLSVNKALKEHYSAIEESKADVTGMHSIPLLVERGWLTPDKADELYTTYLAGIFRSIRFGANEAHGLGFLMQFNFLREKQAILYDPATDKLKINWDRIRDGIKDLAVALLTIEGQGRYEDAAAFIKTYGRMDEVTLKMIQKLKDIPVDIEPLFIY